MSPWEVKLESAQCLAVGIFVAADVFFSNGHLGALIPGKPRAPRQAGNQSQWGLTFTTSRRHLRMCWVGAFPLPPPLNLEAVEVIQANLNHRWSGWVLRCRWSAQLSLSGEPGTWAKSRVWQRLQDGLVVTHKLHPPLSLNLHKWVYFPLGQN